MNMSKYLWKVDSRLMSSRLDNKCEKFKTVYNSSSYIERDIKVYIIYIYIFFDLAEQ